jgi:hypothetical protein
MASKHVPKGTLIVEAAKRIGKEIPKVLAPNWVGVPRCAWLRLAPWPLTATKQPQLDEMVSRSFVLCQTDDCLHHAGFAGHGCQN